MNYLSVCSGIEAATVAWHHIGWKPVGFSEIEKFPSQVLAHHYPQVTNFGDMTKYKEWKIDSVGLLVGGTPCQSFSVAGLRKGLSDPRGNLALTYVGILDHFRPKWFIWENVPGVLSSNQGRDFAAFLTSLGIIGYGWSYRVLDAQYFGVAQRRRRVFVVGCLGDWRPTAEVLFESESLSRNTKSSRKEEQDDSYKLKVGTITKSWGKGLGHNGQDDMAVIHPISFPAAMSGTQAAFSNNLSLALQAKNRTAIACIGSQHPNAAIGENISPTLTSAMGTGGGHIPIIGNMKVRRLTPKECERLQGFPDDYTNIPNAADTNRYKALGNSMAVPVMRWIGERINSYEAMCSKAALQMESRLGFAEV